METTKFNAAIEAVRERFFLLTEFPYLDRGNFPEGVCEAAMDIKPENIEAYSVALSAKQLEALLLDIPMEDSIEKLERIASILDFRFSSRLIKLFFELYQEHYDRPSMQIIMKRLVSEAKRRSRFPDTGSLLWAYGESDDLLQEVKTEFTTSWRLLDDYLNAYHIGQETRLALEIRLQCFSDAGLAMINANPRHLIYLIESLPEKDLEKTISNYIRISDVKKCISEVNVLILQKMGEPALSAHWNGYKESVIKKFSEWCFYHHLYLHSFRYPKKYKVLSGYYNNIKQSYELEGSALVIDFGEIVVVDMMNVSYSFFYYKWEFNREMKEWQEMGQLPSFYSSNPEKISARDYIIENKDEPCMLLQYEGVDLMYIEEILDIQIGLEPDFRRTMLKAKDKAKIKFD